MTWLRNSARSSSTPTCAGHAPTAREADNQISCRRYRTDDISSPLAVRPTSEPSKNMTNVPAVVDPNDVGVNWTMSESSTTPTPDTLGALLKLIGIVPSASRANALMSVLGHIRAIKVHRPTTCSGVIEQDVFILERNAVNTTAGAGTDIDFIATTWRRRIGRRWHRRIRRGWRRRVRRRGGAGVYWLPSEPVCWLPSGLV